MVFFSFAPGITRFKERRLYAFVLSLVLALGACRKEGENGQQGAGPAAGSTWTFDASQPLHAQFSGANALAETKTILDFGPRPPASEALEKVRGHLAARLEGFGWEVRRQAFEARAPARGMLEFANLRARWKGDADAADWDRPAQVIVAAHVDSKYYVSIDFVGANDAASACGALVEYARILPSNPDLARNAEIVFFDGEEAFIQFSLRDGLFGSRHYVHWLKQEVPASQWPRSLVLLDLIGEKKDLGIRMPPNGSDALTEAVLTAAAELGYEKYFGRSRDAILDDHDPFLKKGIPAVDVIDLDYADWHEESDTFDKLSAESLDIVGRTVLLMVEKHLPTALGGSKP